MYKRSIFTHLGALPKTASISLLYLIFFLHLGFLLALALPILIRIEVQPYFKPAAPESEHPAWPPSRSRNISDYLDLESNTSLIVPRAFQEPCDPGLVWIFVMSAPTHFHQRRVARASWLNASLFGFPAFKNVHRGLEGEYLEPLVENKRVQVTFFVGNPKNSTTQRLLDRESLEHGDILQESIHDLYGDLVFKSVLLLKWASSNVCIKKYKFVAKFDDDNFINIPNLIQVLAGGTVPAYKAFEANYDKTTVRVKDERNRLKEPLIFGEVETRMLPHRWKESKYYCPRYLFNGQYFPPYAFGLGYIIRQNITGSLMQASLSTPILHIEDAYITGLLPQKLGYEPTFSNLFTINPIGETCAERGLIAENLYDKFERIPDIVRNVLNASIKCEIISQI